MLVRAMKRFVDEETMTLELIKMRSKLHPRVLPSAKVRPVALVIHNYDDYVQT
jgi:hypothetical protein